jgi:hypothetical protein
MTAVRLSRNRGNTSTSRRRKRSPEISRKNSTRIVVNRPLAKLAVPANNTSDNPEAEEAATVMLPSCIVATCI